MAFTAKDVMALREKTGAGVMDCKKALTDADGDMAKAADILRERGIAKAEKKASRKGIDKGAQQGEATVAKGKLTGGAMTSDTLKYPCQGDREGAA